MTRVDAEMETATPRHRIQRSVRTCRLMSTSLHYSFAGIRYDTYGTLCYNKFDLERATLAPLVDRLWM